MKYSKLQPLLNPTVCALSSGDTDDWDRLDIRPGHASVQNVLYLNDEAEEEEGEEGEDGEEAGEQEQEGRKVTVRNSFKHNTTLFNFCCIYVR